MLKLALSTFFSCLCFSLAFAQSEALHLQLNGRLEMQSDQHFQKSILNVFELDGERIPMNSCILRFFQGESIRLNYTFEAFLPEGEINHLNYRQKGYGLQLGVSPNQHLILMENRLTDETPNFVVRGGVEVAPGGDSLSIALVSNAGEVVEMAKFPVEVFPPLGASTNTVTLFNYIVPAIPVYSSLKESGSGKEIFDRELKSNLMPDTVYVKRGSKYELNIQPERWVDVGSTTYTVAATTDRPLGFTIDYEWLGQALNLSPIGYAQNGLEMQLTATPKRTYGRLQLEREKMVHVGEKRPTAQMRNKPTATVQQPGMSRAKVRTIEPMVRVDLKKTKQVKAADQQAILQQNVQLLTDIGMKLYQPDAYQKGTVSMQQVKVVQPSKNKVRNVNEKVVDLRGEKWKGTLITKYPIFSYGSKPEYNSYTLLVKVKEDLEPGMEVQRTLVFMVPKE